MKKKTYFVYLKESLGLLSGKILEIKCDGMHISHPDILCFYISVNPENSEGCRETIAEFERSEIVGWERKG